MRNKNEKFNLNGSFFLISTTTLAGGSEGSGGQSVVMGAGEGSGAQPIVTGAGEGTSGLPIITGGSEGTGAKPSSTQFCYTIFIVGDDATNGFSIQSKRICTN